MHTRDTPWCDDLDVGFQAIECQLEANLVVTLSSATMGYKANHQSVSEVAVAEGYLLATFTLSNGDHATGNDRASQ